MTKIIIDRAVLERALEALENGKRVRNADGGTKYQPDLQEAAVTDLRTALAEPAEQEVDRLAALGWQSVECDVCGSSARAFPKPAEQKPVAWMRYDREHIVFADRRRDYPHPERFNIPLYEAPQTAIPPGYKLVPEVPTNEWINNLARRQTGSLEDVPFVEIHQCIAELLDAAPDAPQPAKREPLTDDEIGSALGFSEHTNAATKFALLSIAREAIAVYERKNGICAASAAEKP